MNDTREDMYDDALDDAAHAARQAFTELLLELPAAHETELLYKLNDAINNVMRDYI